MSAHTLAGKMFNRLRRNLRGSILTAFSVLLFLSFALIGGIFNIAVRHYIRHNAVSELTAAQNLYATMGRFTHIVRDGIFGQRINQFYLSDDFYLLYGHISPATIEISNALYDKGVLIEKLNNRRVRTEDGVFYVTAQTAAAEGAGWHAIFYVDITDISRFSARVNMLLLLLVAIIWTFAMVITTYLAGSLSHPLHVLNRFAQQIGRGDFTPNPESFANDEFENLNRSLNHTAKQLAKYDNEQKTFFQNVSHELRTPLMSIKSYAEGIKYGIMDAEQASTTILNAADRLKGMVDDILYVSRIDNITTPHEDEIDLSELIAERIRIHETPQQKGIITFTRDLLPIIIPCVKPFIERLMDNLISNALRYAESKVIIECHADGANALIRITDDGPGFEPCALPHVFERFYRGKNGLTGIGLAIVKSITDQHGGTATAENILKANELNETEINIQGARLTITLPRVGK